MRMPGRMTFERPGRGRGFPSPAAVPAKGGTPDGCDVPIFPRLIASRRSRTTPAPPRMRMAAFGTLGRKPSEWSPQTRGPGWRLNARTPPRYAAAPSARRRLDARSGARGAAMRRIMPQVAPPPRFPPQWADGRAEGRGRAAPHRGRARGRVALPGRRAPDRGRLGLRPRRLLDPRDVRPQHRDRPRILVQPRGA